jgi:hypothetical protein
MPSITAGLTFNAPWVTNMVPLYSAAGTTGLSTETGDADGTRTRETDGYIQQAVANTARITPDGVLSEVASENELTYSEDFSNAAWQNLQTPTLTTNNGVAPNASSTADLLGDDNASAHEAKFQTFTATAAAWTVSLYAKAGTSSIVSLQVFRSGGANIIVEFQLTGTGSTDTETGSPTSVDIESLSNGWYRCSITATLDANAFNMYVYPARASTLGSPNVAATGDVLVWGAQAEAQSAPTSYIPTTSAAVTRSADALVYTAGANVVAASGTVIIAATPDSISAANNSILDIYKASPLNAVRMRINAGGPQLIVYSGGASVASLKKSSVSAGETHVYAAVWAENDFRWYQDGGSEQSDTSGSAPEAFDFIKVGNLNGENSQFNGPLKHLLIYNRSLSAAEIAGIYYTDYKGKWAC